MEYTTSFPTWLLADNKSNRCSFCCTIGLSSLWLPRIPQPVQRHPVTPYSIAHELASDNEEAEENGGEHGLTALDICNAYEEVMTAIGRSASDQNVSESIYLYLDGALTDIDCRDETEFDRSLRRFRALSAVSSQCNSSRIGRVMHDFFHSIASFVITVESISAVIIWAYAIHASCMLQDEQKSCLKIVVQNRPEVIEVIWITEPTYSPVWILGRQLHLIQRVFGREGQAGSRLNDVGWSKCKRLMATSASSAEMETALVSLSHMIKSIQEKGCRW